MPSVKLINTIKYDSSGDILMPLMGARKYPSLLFSASLSSQFLGYINNQEDFLNLLPNKIRGLIKLRVFSEEYGWRMKDRLIDHELGGLIDNDKQLNKGFIKRLSGCRLCITTYNGTTHLETFSSNFPTLLFWNKEHWEINQDAQPYFDQLYRIGVLHYDVISLANKVKEIYKDPMYWWQDDSIQRVISGFCNKFAYTEKDALNMWVSELQDLAKSASL